MVGWRLASSRWLHYWGDVAKYLGVAVDVPGAASRASHFPEHHANAFWVYEYLYSYNNVSWTWLALAALTAMLSSLCPNCPGREGFSFLGYP